MAHVIQVKPKWDADTEVRAATSGDVSGLITGAETVEVLSERLRGLIPELPEANGTTPPTDDHGPPFDILAERHDRNRLLG